MDSSRITELASIISANTVMINEHFSAKNLPPLSFGIDANTSDLPPELLGARSNILEATSELHDLLLGPFDLIHTYAQVRYS